MTRDDREWLAARQRESAPSDAGCFALVAIVAASWLGIALLYAGTVRRWGGGE